MTNSPHAFDRRTLLKGLGAALALPTVWTASATAGALEEAAGRLLLIGFPGASPSGRMTQALARQIAKGQAGGVVFLRHNIEGRRNTSALTNLFLSAANGRAPLLCIDQEGGAVQRLKSGYTKIPPAGRIAARMTPRQARDVYARMAREVRGAGFNVNLAPVVDVRDPGNPVIGKYERAYGTDPRTIAAYAGAFVEAHRAAGVACAVKHFPGHGTSRGDSHEGFVDISRTWTPRELEPFRLLIRQRDADIIMGGHLSHRKLAPEGVPITFSKTSLTRVLRGELGFRGAIMTDDLDMGAIRRVYPLSEAVVRSLAAGNDLLLLSNSAKPDANLAPRAVKWIGKAVRDGRLSRRSVVASADRVGALHRLIG